MRSHSLRHPLAAILLLLPACGGDPEPPSGLPPMPDLLAVAERLRAGDNPYFGQAPLRALEAQRAQLAPDADVRRVDLDVQLMWQHLRLGNAEEATAAIERGRPIPSGTTVSGKIVRFCNASTATSNGSPLA